jgi:hypothetical protein
MIFVRYNVKNNNLKEFISFFKKSKKKLVKSLVLSTSFFLPKTINKFTVLKSPHIFKKSKDQLFFKFNRSVLNTFFPIMPNKLYFNLYILYLNYISNLNVKNKNTILNLNLKYNIVFLKKDFELIYYKKYIWVKK